MSKVAIGLDELARKSAAEILSGILANTYTLYLKTQKCHWHVSGPNFVSLHALFEEQYEALSEEVDELAERIRALNHKAPASFSEFLKLSEIQDGERADAAKDMIQMLMADHEKMASTFRNAIESLSALRDHSSADELTKHLAFHEKQAWMLRVQLV